MFHPFVWDGCWGLRDVYSLAILSIVRWLLPPCNDDLNEDRGNVDSQFQFIGPGVTALVGRTCLGRPDGPKETSESRQVLKIWYAAVSLAGLKPEPTVTQRDTQVAAY